MLWTVGEVAYNYYKCLSSLREAFRRDFGIKRMSQRKREFNEAEGCE